MFLLFPTNSIFSTIKLEFLTALNGHSNECKHSLQFKFNVFLYRTFHSYNLIWAVCHLFPQQRWRTHTYSVSGNHWPGEQRDMHKTTSARKFRLAGFFLAISKTCIFYKYVVFKHSISFSQFPLQRWHALSSVWHSSYSPTELKKQKKKKKKMDKPRRHSFLQYTLTMRLFPVSEKPTDCFEPQKERHFKYVSQLNRTFSSLTFL